MKYIKLFESNQIIRKWDYVICSEKYILDNFLTNNIGRVINTNYQPHHNQYSVYYDISLLEEIGELKDYFVIIYDKSYVPSSGYFENVDDYDIVGEGGVREFSKDEILYHSPNKEDLEIYINANKYNL